MPGGGVEEEIGLGGARQQQRFRQRVAGEGQAAGVVAALFLGPAVAGAERFRHPGSEAYQGIAVVVTPAGGGGAAARRYPSR